MVHDPGALLDEEVAAAVDRYEARQDRGEEPSVVAVTLVRIARLEAERRVRMDADEAEGEMAEKMTRDEIVAKVREIVVEYLDVEAVDVTPEAHFIDDLGSDSLGLVEMMLAAEEAFDLDIPDEDTDKIRTVGDAIDYIAGRLGVS